MFDFPYGNNPEQPYMWLGNFNAPSRRWFVSYWAGFSLVAGYHSFIFLGLENLTIAQIHLTGAGVNVNWGAKRAGSTNRAEEVIEAGEEAVNNFDAAKDFLDLNASGSKASTLYSTMMNDTLPTLVTARTPFSLLDLSQAWGMVEGFNVDVYIAGAQVYWLTLHNNFRFVNSDRKYMERQRVANLDDGSIGAGIGSLFGKVTVEKHYDLYHEFGKSNDKNARPYSRIPAVHPFIAGLPPAQAGAPVPPSTLQRLPATVGSE